MGNHGAQIIPFYINIQELIYAHNDQDQKARALQFANVRQELPDPVDDADELVVVAEVGQEADWQ
jgi:hypothetical protein